MTFTRLMKIHPKKRLEHVKLGKKLRGPKIEIIIMMVANTTTTYKGKEGSNI